MSGIAIIGRKLTESEIETISNENAEVICFDDYKLPFDATKIELSVEEKREINYSVLNEIIKFGDKNINGKSVSAHLKIENASVWHYHKFRTYFFVRNLNYELAKLQKLDLGQNNILFYCTSDFNFLVGELPNVYFIFPENKKAKFNLKLTFRYLVFLKLRFFSSLFTRGNKSEILIYYPERYSTILDIDSLKPKQGNFLLDYLFAKIKTPIDLLAEVPMPKLKSSVNFPLVSNYFQRKESKLTKRNIECLLIKHGLGAFRTAKNAGQELMVNYSEVLCYSLSLNERLAIQFVKSLHNSSIYYLTRYFAAKQFFRNNMYKTILATDENSPLAKSILDAAKFHEIKTVGMQHGTMHDLHPAYLYTTGDIDEKIICDYTLVWGEYWEMFLAEKGNFPKESIVKIGHLRTDIIPVLQEDVETETESASFKLVFASQPQRDESLRKQAALDVFTSVKELNDVELIVKLHPREFDDVGYYKMIAQKAGCENYTIDIETDLYQLIASCDALITCFSTVGAETVYFHKPLIILDHLKQDIQSYYKEGVAFQATNATELIQFITDIKDGKLSVDEKAYVNFIRKYAYCIDGKVTERIERFINTLK